MVKTHKKGNSSQRGGEGMRQKCLYGKQDVRKLEEWQRGPISD